MLPNAPMCNLNELKASLVLLQQDVTKFSDFDLSQILFPIAYNSKLSNIRNEQEEESRAHECCNMILEALVSGNFYLNALSKERISFASYQYPNNGAVDFYEERDERTFSSVMDLKEYLEIFREKTWRSFAEINSFCTLAVSTCKTMSLQEAEDVVYAFKLSLELYERAITFDISYSDNAENVLSALENVINSTRKVHTYLWAKFKDYDKIETVNLHSAENVLCSLRVVLTSTRSIQRSG